MNLINLGFTLQEASVVWISGKNFGIISMLTKTKNFGETPKKKKKKKYICIYMYIYKGKFYLQNVYAVWKKKLKEILILDLFVYIYLFCMLEIF